MKDFITTHLIDEGKKDEAMKKMVEALEQFEACNLSDDNCASWKIANTRIRNLASQGLASYRSYLKSKGKGIEE